MCYLRCSQTYIGGVSPAFSWHQPTKQNTHLKLALRLINFVFIADILAPDLTVNVQRWSEVAHSLETSIISSGKASLILTILIFTIEKVIFLDLRWESAVLTLSFMTFLSVLMRSIANQLKSDFVVDVIHPIHVTLRNLARLISKRSRHTPFCVDTVWWVDLKKVWPLGKNLGILPWWYLRSQITWRDVFFFLLQLLVLKCVRNVS